MNTILSLHCWQSRWLRWIPIAFLLGSILTGSVGCQSTLPAPAPQDTLNPGTRPLTLVELADRLGLRVDKENEVFVSLKGHGDTVLIFTQSDGQFSVNGRTCGPVGPLYREGDTLRVNSALADRIKPYLSQSVVRAPAWRRARRPAHMPAVSGTIMIDPGHGGKDPGAISVLGYHEKDINLAVGRQLAAMLRQRGYRIVMTRSRDVFVPLEQRCAMANRTHPDLFVSIHADSCDSPSITGYTLYTAPDASWQARDAAQDLVQALARTGRESRGIKTAEYKVLMGTACPAVLVEMGYLSNTQEARHLRDGRAQQRLAWALALGIDRFAMAAK